MTNPLDLLTAPPVLPDIADPGYHAAYEVLEDHPLTRGADHSTRSSLAQRLADAVNENYLTPADLDKEREEAYEGFKELLERPKVPEYIRRVVPEWVQTRFDTEVAAEAAKAAAAAKATETAGTEMPLAGAA
ncbi:hypothetical protein CcI49_02780 [Frankia sp. CcI49]|uniref:hypothetical protein n=1 Tax=Frankia sp. CcI49 TaxID=1745382 RepID=UPI0009774384|nr:hypothetical protein [Frankia sp. CcI49]ONH62319.1 hypothetical protein CcI49_02780 [Frankia sp. CcI49]